MAILSEEQKNRLETSIREEIRGMSPHKMRQFLSLCADYIGGDRVSQIVLQEKEAYNAQRGSF